MMVEESGISSSLSEDDVKLYLEQVIKEVPKMTATNLDVRHVGYTNVGTFD
jgi:hypothetical protein